MFDKNTKGCAKITVSCIIYKVGFNNFLTKKKKILIVCIQWILGYYDTTAILGYTQCIQQSVHSMVYKFSD